jgi:uncharacterized protein (DUF305 family)
MGSGRSMLPVVTDEVNVLDRPEPVDESQSVGGAGDGDISDDTVERIFKILLGVLAASVVAAVFAGAAVWALRADDPKPLPMNAVDVGFLRDMLDHHDQALEIANIYLDERPDSGVAPYAREVILYQEREIVWMNDWLAEEGYRPGEPDRFAMEWMDEPTPVAEMRGMQSQARLDQLDAATGEDADRLFFNMMTDHHLGGIHMGDHAQLNGANQEIIDFAASVSRNQRIEITEYQMAAERLDLY